MTLPLLIALLVSQPAGPQPPEAPTPSAAPEPSAEDTEHEGADRRRQTVITASRTERILEDVVVPTEVITRRQIEALGVRDLGQLLQQHPGVELVHTFRGTGIRLQGLDPEYVLILVDGERVAGRVGSTLDLGRFTLRDVERVEIVKGPAAALYGAEAIGGVVNLITRRVQKPLEASVRGGFGTLLEGDVRAHAGSRQGPLELRLGGGYRTRTPYDWVPADAATSGAGQRRMDVDAALSWSPEERLRLWARTQYVFRDEDAVDLNPSGALFDRRQRQEQFDLTLGGRGNVAPATALLLRGHFGLFRDQLLQDQRGSRALDDYTQNITRLWEGFAQVDHRVGGHTLTGGAEVLYERLGSSRLEPGRVGRVRVAALVQDEWEVELPANPELKLRVAPGVRMDVDSQFGGAPSPRLAVKLDPSPQVTLRASWGMGFRPPSFQELYLRFANQGVGYVVAGNPGLSAERSWALNASVDWRPPVEGWGVSASGFYTRLNNLINITASAPPDPDNPPTFLFENVAEAATLGMELSARMRLVPRVAWVEVAYMALDARDLTRNRPLEGRASHRANLMLSARHRPANLEATLRGSWVSARPFFLDASGTALGDIIGLGEERQVWAPDYFDLEAQVTYTWQGWLKVFVQGYNLLNAGDQQFNPRPPRGVLGGVQWDY